MPERAENTTSNGVFQSKYLWASFLTTIAGLSKGVPGTMDAILRICERFDVQPGGVMERIPD